MAEGDVELFGDIERLKRLMGEYLKARDAADAAFEKTEADPDKPPFLPELMARLDAEGVKYDRREICREHYESQFLVLRRSGRR